MFNLDPMRILLTIPGIILGFVLHEFAHALVADKLGDPTPRNQGKLTLDPRVHIDLIGFVLIMLVGFGWAKPVQTNPKYYKNPRRDDILVSIAGPLANLAIAVFFAMIFKGLISTAAIDNKLLLTNLLNLVNYTIFINVVLFVLNILPFPFFDGYHVLANIFPLYRYRFFHLMEQYSTIIFMVLAFSGFLGRIIRPIYMFVYDMIFTLLKI